MDNSTTSVSRSYTTINNEIETAGCAAAGSPFAGPWQINEHWHLDDLS